MASQSFILLGEKDIIEMGVVVLGVAIAERVTSAQVEQLKNEINSIIESHKALTQNSRKLSQKIQKLNLAQIYKKVSQMSKNLSQNLNTLVQDQQLKFEFLQKIQIVNIGFQEKSLLMKVLEVLNIVGTVFAFVEIMCATNPVTIAVSGILLALGAILNVFTIVNNIGALNELKEKKGHLEQYYKSGGQFEKDIDAINTLSFQIVQNFYIFVINFRSIMCELSINIQLLSLSTRAKRLSYWRYLDLIKSNPFNQIFENECLQLYKKFVAIQGYSQDQKAAMSCKYIEEFEQKNNVTGRIAAATMIAQNFAETSQIGQELIKNASQVEQLTNLKRIFSSRFEKRKGKTLDQIIKIDRQLLKEIQDQAFFMQEKQLGIAQFVTFYTDKFYGDDPYGNTLYNIKLGDIQWSTQLFKYLLVSCEGKNVINYPQPENEFLKAEWQANKQFLQKYIADHVQHEGTYITERTYIRIENSSFQFKNQTQSRLIFYYGISVFYWNTHKYRAFQLQQSELYRLKMPKVEAMMMEMMPSTEKMQKSDPDLNSLCSYLCFFINGVAYPERVTDLTIGIAGDQYVASVEWSQEAVKPELLGKSLKHRVEELKEGDELAPLDGSLFLSQTLKSVKKVVAFGFK